MYSGIPQNQRPVWINRIRGPNADTEITDELYEELCSLLNNGEEY
jgi:hypothetical protein